MARKLPPRWLNCPRKGKVLAGKFLPFKTPLGLDFEGEMPEECRFSPSMLLEAVQANGHRLGLVVDLTKTDRFYDKADLVSRGVGHYKLKCEGFQSAPTREQVAEFLTVSSHFLRQHSEMIIGVHCTHGFNRTGFLIIAFLVENESWSLEAAISAFAKCRSPGIYKQHYLEELEHRYGDNTGSVAPPQLPSWCVEEEEEEESEERREGEGKDGEQERSDGGRKRRRREFHNENATFAVAVNGVSLVAGATRTEVQHCCQDILNWENSGFPGSQPVSMDRRNMQLLAAKPYRVSWKADGTRYLLFIKGPKEVFLLDRDNSVFASPHLTFPSRNGGHLSHTLLDGELVQEKLPSGFRPRYLAYDIMQLSGSPDVGRCDHVTRLQCIQKEIMDPRELAAQQGVLDKQKEPFSVRLKQFWDVADTQWVLDKFVPKVTHDNDGLIFNPLEDPYKAGPCPELLKWKPPSLNTVDFKLVIVDEVRPGMLKQKVGQLWVGGYHQPFSMMDLKRNKEAKSHNGRIVECSWSPHSGGWTFLRLREDKSFPNSHTTAASVCASIQQPVTRDILLHCVDQERWRPPQKRPMPKEIATDSQLMPPPKRGPRLDPSH